MSDVARDKPVIDRWQDIGEDAPATGRCEFARWRPHATLAILAPIPSPP